MVDNTAHDPSDTNGLIREFDSLSARLGIEDCLPAREYVEIDEGLATEDRTDEDTITLLLDNGMLNMPTKTKMIQSLPQQLPPPLLTLAAWS